RAGATHCRSTSSFSLPELPIQPSKETDSRTLAQSEPCGPIDLCPLSACESRKAPILPAFFLLVSLVEPRYLLPSNSFEIVPRVSSIAARTEALVCSPWKEEQTRCELTQPASGQC